MKNKDIYEMVEILMEMPKEKYAECKYEFLYSGNYKSQVIKDFFEKLFTSIEKHRPELVEGGAI